MATFNSAVHSGLSDLHKLWTLARQCIVDLGKTLKFYGTFLHLGVSTGSRKYNAGGNPVMDYCLIQGGAKGAIWTCYLATPFLTIWTSQTCALQKDLCCMFYLISRHKNVGLQWKFCIWLRKPLDKIKLLWVYTRVLSMFLGIFQSLLVCFTSP